jgi:hypothetical protein
VEELGIAVVVLMLALIVWLTVLSIRNPIVAVADELASPRDPEDVQASAFAVLGAVAGTTLEQSAPGHLCVVLRRQPGWTLVLAVLLFPLGLLFLFIHDNLRLDVTVSAAPSGSAVRVSGRTRKRLAERVGAELEAATA